MRISDWSSDVCSSDLEPPRWRLWLRRTLRWGLGLAVVALVALGVAVGIAVQRMPSFEELKQSPAGQTIRVRAAECTVFLSLDHNYVRSLTPREKIRLAEGRDIVWPAVYVMVVGVLIETKKS